MTPLEKVCYLDPKTHDVTIVLDLCKFPERVVNYIRTKYNTYFFNYTKYNGKKCHYRTVKRVSDEEYVMIVTFLVTSGIKY